LPSGQLSNPDTNCITLDHGLRLSDHVPVFIKLSFDFQIIQSAKDHSQSPKLLDASQQSSTRLRWNHANLYDYYHNLFIKLGPLLDVIDK